MTAVPLLAAALASLVTVAPARELAPDTDKIRSERIALEARLDRLGPAITDVGKSGSQTLAQWYNWPNWFNGWNNWPNWLNW